MARTKVQLRSNLPQIAGELAATVNAVVGKAAFEIQVDAKRTVPVRTGNLRASIQVTQVGLGSWEVYTDVIYAPFVEFGTRSSAAQPYLEPAAAKALPRLRQAVAVAIAAMAKRHEVR